MIESRLRVTHRRKRIQIWSASVVGLLLTWWVCVMVAIARAGAPNPSARGDVAVVLGAAVWDNVPSPVFAARIDHAIKLFRRGQVKKLVFTGGLGGGDSLSEGEVAQRYAIAQGIPTKVILIETRSKNTEENLFGAKRLMDQYGLQSAVIVSDPYHMLRAGMIAKRLGLQHVGSPTETTRYIGFTAKSKQFMRESYNVIYLLFSGR